MMKFVLNVGNDKWIEVIMDKRKLNLKMKKKLKKWKMNEKDEWYDCKCVI